MGFRGCQPLFGRRPQPRSPLPLRLRDRGRRRSRSRRLRKAGRGPSSSRCLGRSRRRPGADRHPGARGPGSGALGGRPLDVSVAREIARSPGRWTLEATAAAGPVPPFGPASRTSDHDGILDRSPRPGLVDRMRPHPTSARDSRWEKRRRSSVRRGSRSGPSTRAS